MSDPLLDLWKRNLPNELAALLADHIRALEAGEYLALLQHPLVTTLLGKSDQDAGLSPLDQSDWTDSVTNRVNEMLRNKEEENSTSSLNQHIFLLAAIAALFSFLQSNATGPPLPFSSPEVIFPTPVAESSSRLDCLRRDMIRGLGMDGEAAYRLTPNVELLCLANAILSSPSVLDSVVSARWTKLRVDFVHQRLLSEVSPTLQRRIYDHLALIEAQSSELASSDGDLRVGFLLERAAIHTRHGLEKEAREDIQEATKLRGFEFVLTGLLGKRTKFQQNDLSQLVVLARSAGSTKDLNSGTTGAQQIHPEKLDLNDDTLLESISFAGNLEPGDGTESQSKVPPSLAAIDPANQPLLEPLDSIILLALASSITNTSPAHGLTREETLPYATRVLQGGSSNWQVYTQALLVRSRIEGYSTRTVERGLLQFQTVVDQIIADTTNQPTSLLVPTTFLPRSEESTSAPANERLRYIFPLCSPLRWELEAELASRWVSLGGLKTALEIYERLEMWAEAALCWAATDREDKAKIIVRKLLFHPTNGEGSEVDEEKEEWKGPERVPPPDDAPRLYCILGDIDHDTTMYEKAWDVSNGRYARAQRSLGRQYLAAGDNLKAAKAYSQSLKVNQLNHSSWFALGCALLELEQFDRAVEAFTRVVQLDDTDAEAWSNLAAALLHQDPEKESQDNTRALSLLDDEEGPVQAPATDPQKSRKEALRALKHAARLKRESYRIWDNLLTVAASLSPPAYQDMVTAQRAIIERRGKTDGEKCIDENIIDMLVRYVVSLDDTPAQSGAGQSEDSASQANGRFGIQRIIVELIDREVVPLITSSSRLWLATSRLALWRGRPSSALEASEKAWRVVVSRPGWEQGTKEQWNKVVDATIALVEAYESLGPREKTEGLAAGSGEVVAKDWKFKARSAIRGIKGRGKDSWEGTEGWERLDGALEGLR